MRSALALLVLIVVTSSARIAASDPELTEAERELLALILGDWVVDIPSTLEMAPPEEREIMAEFMDPNIMVMSLSIREGGIYEERFTIVGETQTSTGTWQVLSVDLDSRTLLVSSTDEEQVTDTGSLTFVTNDRLVANFANRLFPMVLVRYEGQSPAQTPPITTVQQPNLPIDQSLVDLLIGSWRLDVMATVAHMAPDDPNLEEIQSFLASMRIVLNFSPDGSFSFEMAFMGEAENMVGNWQVVSTDAAARSFRVLTTPSDEIEQPQTFSMTFQDNDSIILSNVNLPQPMIFRRR